VAWLLRARVHVSVVLWDQVNIVKDEALERVLLQSLDERDVHDARFVERCLAVLYRTHTQNVSH